MPTLAFEYLPSDYSRSVQRGDAKKCRQCITGSVVSGVSRFLR
jgi:hypothetical protein